MWVPTDEEMAAYGAPFPTPESRRPTWRFPNELPITGEPADVYATMLEAHYLEGGVVHRTTRSAYSFGVNSASKLA